MSVGAAAVTGIILVGGRSRRMGRDKATLVVEGRTLVQRAADALVAAGATELVVVGAATRDLPPVSATLPIAFARDAIDGDGPLRGLIAGLEQAHAPVAILVGCDMPFLQPALLALLARRSLECGCPAVPLHDGLPEALCSAWPTASLERVRALVDGGERAMATLARALGAAFLPPTEYAHEDPSGQSFVNLNTPADLQAIADAGPR